jgi:hypothetical protein
MGWSGLIVEIAVRVVMACHSGLRYEAMDAGIADVGVRDGVQDKGYHWCHSSWRKEDSPVGRSRDEARYERRGTSVSHKPAGDTDRP